MPDVSFAVILTRNADRAAAALRSIAAQDVSHELLLVLNDADDEMRQLAAGCAVRGARVLHDGADIGVMLAYNLAIREARGRFVCTVHEDSVLSGGCAARLQATMIERPEAAAVGPSVDTPHATGVQANLVWRDGATSQVTIPPELTDDVQAIDYAGTHCLMMRREAAAAVGGFDTHFFPAIYGDVALCVAFWEAGWTVLCDRRAHNAHRTGAMVDAERGPRRGARIRAFLLERNRARFVTKHAAWLAQQPVRVERHSALSPGAEEVVCALDVAAARARGASGPPEVGRPTLALPADPAASAATWRRAFEDEFLDHLIDREITLRAEADGLHRAYAELHRELDQVHRAYAELHRELDQVHRAYAELAARSAEVGSA